MYSKLFPKPNNPLYCIHCSIFLKHTGMSVCVYVYINVFVCIYMYAYNISRLIL